MREYLTARVFFFFSIVALVGGSGACAGSGTVPAGKASSPTEAYKMLYTSVKAKNPEDIKLMLSKDTVRFAEGVAAQAKKTFNEQIRNGFSRTTFADKMPEIRDERVDGNYGAVEVYNAGDNRWEDLPFVLEEGGWKLAVGNVFAGSWKRPGLPQSIREQQNANAAGANNMVPYGNVNVNVSNEMVNTKPIVPKPMPNANAAPGNKMPSQDKSQ